MRNAKYRDYWRKVDKRTPAHSAIKNISYKEASFSLANLQVISGQNGSGKSSLLRHFASSNYLRPPIFEEVKFEIQTSNLGTQEACIFQYTSPSWLVEENSRRIEELRSAGQFEEYINGLEPFAFNEDLLEYVNYILNTSFKHIHIQEAEQAEGYETTSQAAIFVDESSSATDQSKNNEAGLSFSDDILEGKALYIKCSASDDEPKETRLSQGEQYIILLTYLLNNRKGRSVLIDEPETYLSPLSQYRLADVLAYFSVENKLQFILATHSICFIEKTKASSTLMLDGIHGAQLDLTTGKRVASFLRRLGYKVPKENIALFEDEGAKRFFINIALSFDADWLASMELISLSGESDITAIIERVKNYKITAIYDADQKGKTNPEQFKDHRVIFLPGTYAPEEELIRSIKKNREGFAQNIGISLTDLNGCMRMIDGIDHHDYFNSLAELTGRDRWRLFDEAFTIWLPENNNLVEDFIKGFA